MAAAILLELIPELRFVELVDFCCAAIETVCVGNGTVIGAGVSVDGLDAAVALEIHH